MFHIYRIMSQKWKQICKLLILKHLDQGSHNLHKFVLHIGAYLMYYMDSLNIHTPLKNYGMQHFLESKETWPQKSLWARERVENHALGSKQEFSYSFFFFLYLLLWKTHCSINSRRGSCQSGNALYNFVKECWTGFITYYPVIDGMLWQRKEIWMKGEKIINRLNFSSWIASSLNKL